MKNSAYGLFFIALAATAVYAEPAISLSVAPAAATASTATVTAIPIPEVPVQAESASASLRDLQTDFSSDSIGKIIDQELPTLNREISARHQESSRILTTAPSLELLRGLNRDWQKLHQTLGDWTHDLSHRIAQLDEQIARLALLQETWQQTLQLAKSSNTPAPVLNHVQSVLDSIGQTRAVAERRRGEILDLQNRVAEVDARVTQALSSVQHAREQALSRIFTRDSLPLWDGDLRTRSPQSLLQEGHTSFSSQVLSLRAYAERQPEKFFAHAAVFFVLIIALYWVRRRAATWTVEEPSATRALRILNAPIATALLLSILVGGWIYPEAPRLFWALLGTAALFPAVLILRQLLEHSLWPVLNALVVFYFVDRLRMIAAALPLLSRLLFILELLVGSLFFIWLLNPARLKTVPAADRDRLWKAIHAWTRIALILFAISSFASLFGYVGLANLLGNAVLRSAYLAVVLYAALQIVEVLVIFLLRVPPLSRLGMVNNHRAEINKDARWTLDRLALAFWIFATLELLAVRAPLFRLLHAILRATLTVGAISISLGSLLEFGVVVWLSVLTSRFVRFILEEDVYPRVGLARGLPYAISTVLNYLILFTGFVFAMGAMGLDMTKFTILAGAFGVGLGFGLQNILNNFFSGLILLFERPIKVGDVIQIEDANGVVERIGIRASTIRTMAGTEVIIPNGSLISTRVTNWTFSSYQRTIDIPVSVAPEADPAKVVPLLEEVVRNHPHVAKTPPPKAFVMKMSATSLDFEIHAFTGRIDDWNQVRSDLSIAIHAALMKAGVGIR